MRTLTLMERDALIEVCNVGVSQAAKQLSILLNDEVEISVPSVKVVDLPKLPEALSLTNDEIVSCVRQGLSGDMTGSASLLFHNEESRALVASLVGNVKSVSGIDLSEFEHEAVMEIGNIIMSSCLSAIGNFLGNEVGVNIPTFFQARVIDLCNGIGSEIDVENNTVIVITTKMKATKRNVAGLLLITFTVPSLDFITTKLAQLVGGLEANDE